MATKSTKAMERSMLSYLVPFVGMYVAQQLDSSNFTTLLITRIAYGLMCITSIIVYYKIRLAILAAADESTVTYVPDGTKKSKRKQAAITCSVKEYDMMIYKKELRLLILSGVVLTLAHAAFGAFTPLVVGVFSAPVTLFDSPLAKIHLMGQTNIDRPFSEPETLVQAIKSDISSAAPEKQRTAQEAAEMFRQQRMRATRKV